MMCQCHLERRGHPQHGKGDDKPKRAHPRPPPGIRHQFAIHHNRRTEHTSDRNHAGGKRPPNLRLPRTKPRGRPRLAILPTLHPSHHRQEPGNQQRHHRREHRSQYSLTSGTPIRLRHHQRVRRIRQLIKITRRRPHHIGEIGVGNKVILWVIEIRLIQHGIPLQQRGQGRANNNISKACITWRL